VIYLDSGRPPAAAAASWVSPDLSTWSELSGASYDHAGSSWSSNGGTMRISATHGLPDAGLDAGGIVSADLGLTFGDVIAVVVEFAVGTIPTDESGDRGIAVGLINTNSLEANKGVLCSPIRLGGGNHKAGGGLTGTTMSVTTGSSGALGVARVVFPFTAAGPADGQIAVDIGGTVRSKQAGTATAFDTGCRLVLLALRGSTGSLTIDAPLTSIRYQVITA